MGRGGGQKRPRRRRFGREGASAASAVPIASPPRCFDSGGAIGTIETVSCSISDWVAYHCSPSIGSCSMAHANQSASLGEFMADVSVIQRRVQFTLNHAVPRQSPRPRTATHSSASHLSNPSDGHSLFSIQSIRCSIAPAPLAGSSFCCTQPIQHWHLQLLQQQRGTRTMEATGVSLGKAALRGALGYASSKAAEEIALQLDVELDVNFIRDELQMMQSFLMTADEEQSQNKVLATWVKQIGVLSYKVEDSLMDFGLHSEKKPFLGCIPRNPGDRRRIAKEVKQLRAEVEDVSNRNLRYHLIKDSSGSKPTAAEEQASLATAAMFGINEARLTTLEHEKSADVNLHQLITSSDVDPRVIAVWGTAGDLGKMSAIQEVYDDPMILKRFGFRAWIRLMHPFNPHEFLRSLVRQFYENSHDEVGKPEQETNVGADVLAKMEKMDQNDLIHVFKAQLCSNSYLIVMNDLSTIEDWHCIKKYFPDNKKQSRLVISTQQVEIARLCTEKPYQVSEFKPLSCDQTIYLFHKKLSNSEEQISIGSVDTNEARLAAMEKAMCASCSAEPVPDPNKVTTAEKNTAVPTDEIQEENQEPNIADEDKACNSTARKKFDRSRTLALADEVICGRETEKSVLIKLVDQLDNDQGYKVISVWGMGGLGKTTLVRSVYRQLGDWKRAWATAMRPFNPEVLLRDLALQLQITIQEDPARATSTGGVQKTKLQALNEGLAQGLKTKKCLVVIDDLWSISEWDSIKQCLCNAGMIIVTTREKNIAKHCSIVDKNMYCLEGLKEDAALVLFIKKAPWWVSCGWVAVLDIASADWCLLMCCVLGPPPGGWPYDYNVLACLWIILGVCWCVAEYPGDMFVDYIGSMLVMLP